MSFPSTHSVRDELAAALLLAIDYLRGLLRNGINRQGIMRNCTPGSVPVARGALLLIFTFLTGIFMVLRRRIVWRRERQPPPGAELQDAPLRVARVAEGNDTETAGRAPHVTDDCNNISRRMVGNDFDADGHMQKLLEHFRSSMAGAPEREGSSFAR
ncbi:hypothetical protein DQ04_00631050 [Trypanosoma grayi]|uniref:hypothetical protein n=1 Tax=Trypanosoma grayi TaxID=71804 RepID=UPI0004F48C02|nr:hypothetical protein DQ04_00631050 [Trypanosoma grayi]KEG14081.1 hypothetical protein DQ04_00631050 [Trypanosoma grayi]